MSIYEITFISREDKNQTVQQLIQQLGGKILSEKSLGRKKFTYRIKKENAGFYTTVVFELEADQLKELDKDLRINQGIIRHLIISWQREFSAKELPNKLTELQKQPTEEIKKKRAEEGKEERIEKGEEKKEKIKEVKKEKVEPAVSEKKVVEDKEISAVKATKEKEEGRVEKGEKEKERIKEVKEGKPEAVEAKPPLVIIQPKKEAVSEEERLAKLEEKLDELLKE